ncbi:DUF3997 domain-containing protein [Chryseobacterium sp.]|jgi:hypothetical protein|uniref:DUF3997 domain-containing protein n=1 Tax=Chryseobacterium sp. TaxID=1871047 RepID=UPI00284D9067|nr:DUF3997 domain-containing protein [Chryseobacterium sp.]MDR3023159.1 DUF3997 domain-containing protein [Chryseobacterium sp.]
MNKYIKTLLVFCGLILAILTVWFFQNPESSFAFGPGVQDFSKNLTGGYKLYRNSAHEIFIAPADGWNSEIAIIPSKVIRVNVYDEFIIAERQGLKRRNPNDSLDIYEVPDENVKDFWILDTDKNYALGNLNRTDFKRKLDSLHIPAKIELVDIYKY